MLTFYFAPGSSAMAPHIALHEIGVPFQARSLSFARQEQLSPDFLAINPEGKVPTLVIDGRVLTEVAAILWYLAKQHPAAGLLPDATAATEAQALSWMSFIASTLHPARSRGLEPYRKAFEFADRRLGASQWVLGRYSIVDIHLFRLFWRFVGSARPGPGEYPNLSAHYDRMMARAAVRRTCEIESAIGYELPG